jgi:molybdate transport repressor ModE-like protein
MSPSAPISARYRLDRLRLRHFRLLEIIGQQGSLGAGARELGISQPAATLLLRELEQVFGARLVDRDARGGRLTPAGRRALDRLVIARSAIDHAIEAAQAPQDLPTLRAGFVQLLGFTALPHVVSSLLAQGTLGYMQIEEGETRTLLRSLAAGELDCVVGWLDESIAAVIDLDLFIIEPLWSGQMQVFASAAHPLMERKRLSVQELAAWPWVVPSPRSRTYDAFQRLFLSNGVAAPRPRVVCPSVHAGLHIVATGNFLGVAPDHLVAAYRGSQALRSLPGKRFALARTHLSFFALKQAADFAPVLHLKQALKRAGGTEVAKAPGAAGP